MKNFKKIATMLLTSVALTGVAAFAACLPPETPHQHSLSKVEGNSATCTTDGNLEYWTCSGCDDIFSDENGVNKTTLEAVTISAGHTLTHYDAVEPDTQTEGNIEYWYCSGCQKYYTDENAQNETTADAVKLDKKTEETHMHDLTKHDAAEASCTTDGNLAYWTCSGCSDIFSDENGANKTTLEAVKIPASHNLTKHDAAEASCTTDGNVAYWTCSGCSDIFSDENGANVTTLEAVKIPASHNLTKHDAAEASCTTDGNVAYWTCSGCSDIFSDENGVNKTTLEAVKIPASHNLTKHDAAEASCTTDGNLAYWTCSGCDDIFSDENGANKTTLEAVTISAGHTLTHYDAVEPDTQTEGNIEYWYCSGCQKYYTDENAQNETTADAVKLDKKTEETHTHNLTKHEAVAAWKTDGNVEYWSCSGCQKYFADEECLTEIELADTVIASQALPTGGTDLGDTVAKSSTASTSFWKVTAGNTTFDGGWYAFGANNLGTYGGGTGLPTLVGTVENPQYLEFTTASRFELFHVKDDVTDKNSVSYVHLGDNGSSAWANNKHSGLYDYAFLYNFDVTANGAFIFDLCGTSGAKADQSSTNAGFAFKFSKNTITLIMANVDRATATLPATFNFGDGEHHSIAISLNRWGTRQIDVKVYIDGYMAFFVSPADLTKNVAHPTEGYIQIDDGLYNGFGQRFSVIPQINSEEGAETTTYTTVRIHDLAISRHYIKEESEQPSLATVDALPAKQKEQEA